MKKYTGMITAIKSARKYCEILNLIKNFVLLRI